MVSSPIAAPAPPEPTSVRDADETQLPPVRTLQAAIDLRRREEGGAPDPDAQGGVPLGDRLHDAVEASRGDIRWQTFLNPNAAGSDVGTRLGGAPVALTPALNRTQASATDVAGGSVSRANASAYVALPDTGGQSLALSRDPFVTGAGYRAELPSAAGRATLGVDIWGSRHIKGIGVAGGFAIAGASLGGALGATLVTRAGITPLEKYNPDTSAGVEVLTSVKTEVLPVFSIGLQGGELHAGGGFRITGSRGRAVEHQKWMKVEDLSHELRRRDVWYDGLRETAAALGVVKGLRLPKARELARGALAEAKLRVGESLTWVHTQGVGFSLSAGGMGARASASASLSGEHKMILTRPEADVMELEVACMKVGSLSVSGEVPMLAEVYRSCSTALAARRIYRFRLAHEAARLALGRALAGEMPSTLALAPVDAALGDRLLGLFAGERLPAGVETLGIEAAQEHESTRGVAGLKPIFFTDSLDAIAREVGHGTGARVAVTDQATVIERSATSRKHTELVRLNKEHRVVATSEWAPSLDAQGRRETLFQGVRVEVTFDHARGSHGARRQLADKLERHLGLPVHAAFTRAPLAAPGGQGRLAARWRTWRGAPAGGPLTAGAPYRLTLARLLDPADIAAIAKSSPLDVAKAAAQSHLPPAPLTALVHALADAGDAARGEQVAAFIARHRSRGVGALVRLAGGGRDPYEVTVHNGAVDAFVAEVCDQTFRAIALSGAAAITKEAGRFAALLRRFDGVLADYNADAIMRSLDEEGFRHGLAELFELRERLRLMHEELLADRALAS